MVPRKRRRRNQESAAAPETILPADLLLEIVARSDPATLVRCAAVCKSFRCDILSPSFIRHVARRGGIAPKVLAYLQTCPTRNRKHDIWRLISLVHPATPAASRFTYANIRPYIIRRGIGLLGRYDPVASRGGLVLLRHRCDIGRSEHRSDLCVYNPMDGDRVHLSDPPGQDPSWYYYHTFVLLTAADGIGCSFQLLAINPSLYNENGGCRITMQMAKPSEANGVSWGPPTSYGHHRLPYGSFQEDRDAVVLQGGIIHWLLSGVEIILTYDIRTKKMGTVKLPPTNCGERQRIIGRSPDGKLQLLTVERFMISMWLQLPDGWAREAVIDTEQKLRSLHPYISEDRMMIEFERSGEMSGVVLLWAHRYVRGRLRHMIVLDMETKEMHKQDWYSSILFEVDLPARLRSMKIFP